MSKKVVRLDEYRKLAKRREELKKRKQELIVF